MWAQGAVPAECIAPGFGMTVHFGVASVLSFRSSLRLYTSWLIVCVWFDRHSVEMDALRASQEVRAAELGAQLAQLQVRLPFTCLIWAASHVQCKEAWQL